jgi:hypothetical protein
VDRQAGSLTPAPHEDPELQRLRGEPAHECPWSWRQFETGGDWPERSRRTPAAAASPARTRPARPPLGSATGRPLDQMLRGRHGEAVLGQRAAFIGPCALSRPPHDRAGTSVRAGRTDFEDGNARLPTMHCPYLIWPWPTPLPTLAFNADNALSSRQARDSPWRPRNGAARVLCDGEQLS